MSIWDYALGGVAAGQGLKMGGNTALGALGGLGPLALGSASKGMSDADKKSLAAKLLMGGISQMSQSTPIEAGSPIQRQVMAPQQIGMISPSGR